jgi:GntR family transcriptional regulator
LRDWLGEAKAKQVYLILRDRIVSGAFGFGAKLPTENDLSGYYGVSRVTVRRALGELARERFIERRRSAGTRVIYRPAPAPMTADISGVLANIADMGRRSAVRLLAFDYVPAAGAAAVAQALGVGPDQLLQRSVRVRAVDRVPFSYLTTHVPESIAVTFTKQDLASRPLLELLERAGVKVARCGAGARGAPRIAADRARSRRLRSIRPRRRASACALPARPLRFRNGLGALGRDRHEHLVAGGAEECRAQQRPRENHGVWRGRMSIQGKAANLLPHNHRKRG